MSSPIGALVPCRNAKLGSRTMHYKREQVEHSDSTGDEWAAVAGCPSQEVFVAMDHERHYRSGITIHRSLDLDLFSADVEYPMDFRNPPLRRGVHRLSPTCVHLSPSYAHAIRRAASDPRRLTHPSSFLFPGPSMRTSPRNSPSLSIGGTAWLPLANLDRLPGAGRISAPGASSGAIFEGNCWKGTS